MANATENVDLDERLCISTASLLSLLEDITGTVGTKRSIPRGRESSLDELSDQCHSLYKSVSELELILKIYVTHLTDNQADSFPIDPSLEDWLRICHVTALQIQEALLPPRYSNLEHALHEPESSRRQDRASATAALYRELASAAATHVEHLQAFLPILKADLDDFLAAQIVQTEMSTHRPNEHSSHAAPRFPPPSNAQGVPLIRHTLYDLRDAMKVLQAKLSNSPQCFNNAATVVTTQKRLITQLDEMLTNHASEWLEATLAGKMTFAEFSRLNVFDLRMCMGSVTKLNRKSVDKIMDDELQVFLYGTLSELMGMFRLKMEDAESMEEGSKGVACEKATHSAENNVSGEKTMADVEEDAEEDAVLVSREAQQHAGMDIDSEAIESPDDVNSEWEVVSEDDLTGEGNVIVGLGREGGNAGVVLPMR